MIGQNYLFEKVKRQKVIFIILKVVNIFLYLKKKKTDKGNKHFNNEK